MKNAEWMIKNGYKFSDLRCFATSCNGDYVLRLKLKYVGTVTGFSAFTALEKWLDAEHKEPILDDAERRYLKAVIRPFRDKVTAICKVNDIESDYIVICLEFENVCLPDFPTGTMYKGMKKGHDYTIEELGL